MLSSQLILISLCLVSTPSWAVALSSLRRGRKERYYNPCRKRREEKRKEGRKRKEGKGKCQREKEEKRREKKENREEEEDQALPLLQFSILLPEKKKIMTCYRGLFGYY